MSNLISREEVLQYAMEDNSYYKYVLVDDIKDIPPVDIIEHARAIKEYCDGKKCDKCKFKSKDPMYICSLSHEVPYFWDLPEREKDGAE